MRNREKLTALIAGADHPTGLGTARALANLNIQIVGLSTNPISRFCRSRSWSRIVTVDNCSEAYLEKLIVLGKSSPNKIVIFPANDHAVLLLSNHRNELARYYDFVLPEKSTVDSLMDKTAFHEWAINFGFPVPQSYIVESQSDLDNVLSSVKYPIVIKPLFRTTNWDIKSPKKKILRLNSKDDIKKIGFDLFGAATKFIVQRWVSGGDSNVYFCLIYIDRDGNDVAYYTGKKLLQWPRLTGSTCIAVGNSNPEVYKLTREVFLRAKFRGLGSLEVKKSDEDDNYYITEPTVGRNDLQSYIAVTGGINLTKIAFYDAIKKLEGFSPPGKRKATWISEPSLLKAMTDINHHRDFSYSEVLNALNNKIAFSHFSWNDPIPLILYFKNLFLSKFKDFF